MSQSGDVSKESMHEFGARATRALNEFDKSADHLLDHVRGHRSIDRVMYGASALEEVGMVVLTLAALRGLSGDRRWESAARIGAAVAVQSFAVNIIIKSLIRRQRPVPDAPAPYPIRRPLTFSFPSAHAASAFCTASLLADGRPKQAPLYYGAATLVATSRPYVGVHHASDALGGAALGLVWGHLCRHLARIAPK